MAESALVAYLTFFLGVHGFLRWAFCLWPPQPRHSDGLNWSANPKHPWHTGDMYFVLPGHDGHPVSTLRCATQYLVLDGGL